MYDVIIWFSLVGFCLSIDMAKHGDVCFEGCKSESRSTCLVSKLPCDNIVQDPGIITQSPVSATSKPQNLRVHIIREQRNRKLKITWWLPNNASYKVLSGFILMLSPTKHMTNDKECIYVNMTGTDWKNYNPAHAFTYSCLEDLKNHTTYKLQLYNIPVTSLTAFNSAVLYFHCLPVQKDIVPSKWGTFINFEISYHRNGAAILITFTLAPSRFEFEKYSVHLLNEENESIRNENIDINDLSKTEEYVIFENISKSGKYRINIRPVNTFGHCICGEIGFNCKSCSATITDYFNITYNTLPPTEYLNISTTVLNKVGEVNLQTNVVKETPVNNILMGIITAILISVLFVITIIAFTVVKLRYDRKRQLLHKSKSEILRSNSLGDETLTGLVFGPGNQIPEDQHHLESVSKVMERDIKEEAQQIKDINNSHIDNAQQYNSDRISLATEPSNFSNLLESVNRDTSLIYNRHYNYANLNSRDISAPADNKTNTVSSKYVADPINRVCPGNIFHGTSNQISSNCVDTTGPNLDMLNLTPEENCVGQARIKNLNDTGTKIHNNGKVSIKLTDLPARTFCVTEAHLSSSEDEGHYV